MITQVIAELDSLEQKRGILLTQFYRKGPGLCLQIDVQSYATFNKQQVQQLVKGLQNWLGENELPPPVGKNHTVFSDEY